MKKAWSFWCAWLAVTALVVAFHPPAEAGFLNDLKTLGNTVSKDLKTAGQHLGIVDKDKLPGGVSNRLKKADRELNKAEKALKKGAGTAADRAARANGYLERAKAYRAEIDKRYAGKFKTESPRVKAVDKRIEDLSQRISEAQAQAKAAAPAPKPTAPASQPSAKPAVAPAAQAAAKPAAAPAGAGGMTSDQWEAKLKPFVTDSSGKAFYPYATEEQKEWDKWNAIWAELGPLWKQYKAASIGGGKSPSLASLEKRLGRFVERYQQLSAKHQAKVKAEAASRGGIVFSKSPINPGSPQNLSGSFRSGDHIYALIQVKSPWNKLYKAKKGMSVRIDVTVDGKKIHAQFIQIHSPEYAGRTWLPFEIAPAPGQMKAYSDPNLEYGKSNATMRQGPMEMSHQLSKLGPGKHNVAMIIRYYGKTLSQGSFSIEGSSFAAYADLNKTASKAVAASTILPRAKWNNPGLTGQMKDLVKKAGWPAVYRLNIVDKDWWINRVSGGNSPVSSRHVAAAVMARDGQGYYYKVCTFEQPRLISGAWGALGLKHTGARVPILEANKDK